MIISNVHDIVPSYFIREYTKAFNIADYLVDLTMHASAPVDPYEYDELEYQHGGEDGRTTRAISTIAVKSIPSLNNVSLGDRSNASASASLYSLQWSCLERCCAADALSLQTGNAQADSSQSGASLAS